MEVEFGGIGKGPWDNTKAGFTFSGKINRNKWNLNRNAALETGGVLVREEVWLLGEILLVKTAWYWVSGGAVLHCAIIHPIARIYGQRPKFYQFSLLW